MCFKYEIDVHRLLTLQKYHLCFEGDDKMLSREAWSHVSYESWASALCCQSFTNTVEVGSGVWCVTAEVRCGVLVEGQVMRYGCRLRPKFRHFGSPDA